MSVLGYTTKLKVAQSIGEIFEILGKYGAENAHLLGPVNHPLGVAFALDAELGFQTYILKVDSSRIFQRLLADRDAGLMRSAFVSVDQAERIAWRQLTYWLESHLAVIEGGLFTAGETLAPFLEIAPGWSIYELLKEEPGRLALTMRGTANPSK